LFSCFRSKGFTEFKTQKWVSQTDFEQVASFAFIEETSVGMI